MSAWERLSHKTIHLVAVLANVHSSIYWVITLEGVNKHDWDHAGSEGLPLFLREPLPYLLKKSSHGIVLKYASESVVSVKDGRGDLQFIMRWVN